MENVDKIYSTCTLEDVNDSVNNFFEEVMKRKRDDPYSDGLLAAGVIFNNCYATMINGNDGRLPHHTAHIALMKYLENYYELEELNLELDGIDVRMICNERELTIMINSYIDIQSEFEYCVLKAFTRCVDEYYKNNVLDNVMFQIAFTNDYFGYIKWDNTSYLGIIDFLDSEKKQEAVRRS